MNSPSHSALHQDTVLERLSGFIALLREEHFLCDTSSTLTAVQIANQGYIQHKLLLRMGLRSCLCHSRNEWRRFDDLFDYYWQSTPPTLDDVQSDTQENDQAADEAKRNRLIGFSASSDEQDLDRNVTGAGDFKSISLADFRFVFDQQQMKHIESLVDALSQRIRRERRRRKKTARKGHSLDLRRSQHKALATAGIVRELTFQQPIKRLPAFLLLLDVSQSMEVYSKLFLRFTRQLMSEFDRSSAYAFNTELFPLGMGGSRLTEKDFELAMNEYTKGWLGGTRIADCFQQFNREYAQHAINTKTTVVIFSDGYDTAKPEKLIPEIETLQRRAKKIIWVNPLLGRYEQNEADPKMDPLKPYLDVYTSGHNLTALSDLGKLLMRS